MMIETLTFRLAAPADEAAFLDADRAFQTEFIPNHPGFFRRTTAHSADGDWIVITLWRSAEDAATSAALEDDSPVARTFSEMLDPATVERRRYTTLD